MKKLLLFALLTLSTLSGWAVTDGQQYASVNGINVKNLWMFDRVHARNAYTSSPICNTNARTATMTGGVVYVSRSQEKQVVIPKSDGTGNDTILQGVIHCFDALTGESTKDLDLTLNGNPYGVFLGNTCIGCDNFGHIWVAPMTSASAAVIPIYQVDTETGAMTLVTNMDKGDVVYRTDYLDLIGDLTLEEAECNIMTIGHNSNDPGFPTVYRWHNDQGGDIDTWEGGFEGDPYLDFVDFYPTEKTGFSLAPVIKMIISEDEDTKYSGELFYIDCFDGAPVLYDVSGSVIDSFENVPEELWPTRAAANGMNEFALGDRHFFAYAKADSLGKVNDSGLRVHCFAVEKGVDSEGNEEVTLLTFKAYNGMGVYKIGAGVKPDEAVPGDVNGDGVCNASDVTALYQYILNNDASAIVNGDQNDDGAINASDVTTVYNIILGS